MMKTYTILKARIYVKTYTTWIENKKKFNYKDYKNSKKYLNAKIKKIYDCLLQIKKKNCVIFYLVHIFFDDAFKPRKVNGKPGKGRHVNEYVKLLEKCVPNTAKYEFISYHSTSLNPI